MAFTRLATPLHAELSDITADDHHDESHTVASHSDTTGTGAELNSLTDASEVSALHHHRGRVGSDMVQHPLGSEFF